MTARPAGGSRSDGLRLRGRHRERLDDAFETFEDTFESLLFVQEVRSIALDDLHVFIGQEGREPSG